VARYTDEARERVRDAVDFVELVGARTELRRAGANRYVGLCPFHEERTPSFGIDPGAKLYHCFGCGRGGDVFRFVMETESLDFAGALEALADRFGVELEREAEDPRDAARRARRERLLALLERTAAYYVRVLWEAAEAEPARSYLAERGLSEGVLREFRVGWSPSAWDRVLVASRQAGYSEEELLAAGLASRGRGGRGVFDRFRSRIMFPLADARGRVLGFGARALRDNQGPKYLNSSDGEVYRKGQHVYAHDVARAPAARAGAVVLAEGYTDVIALHGAGIRNVVGLMGTALTSEQADKLRQLAPAVLLCLDADAAGREAMARAAELLVGERREVRVVALPAGSDPAELVRDRGPDAVRALLEQAVPFARFAVDRVLERGDLRSPEGRDRAVEALRPVFAGVPEGFLREDLLRAVSDRFPEDTTPDLLAQLLPPRGRAGGRAAAAAAAGRPATPDLSRGGAPWGRGESTERTFLALCLAVPDGGARLLAESDLDALFSSELTRRAARHLATHLDHPMQDLPHDDDELARLIAELVVRAAEFAPDPNALAVERLQLDKQRLEREIIAARRSGGSTVALAAERQRVQDAIRHRLV